MLIHDCDLRLGLHAKRVFDAVGHYSRDDVLGELPRPSLTDADRDLRAVNPEDASQA